MKEMMIAVLTISGLGLVFGVLLAWVSKKFQVDTDPQIARVTALLPGINCGACGFAGCSGLAEAVTRNEAEVNVCVACSVENKRAISEAMGLTAQALEKTAKQVAVISCGGGNRSKNKFEYQGLPDCRVAALAMGGHKECRFACLEQGTCVRACLFGAILMQPEGVPKVIPEKCVGCRKCVAVCPRKLIFMNSRDKDVYINCHSHDNGAVVMKKCKVGCIACGKCVKVCPVNAITIIDNLAAIDYKKCTNCKKCVDVCPTKAIVVK
jgi:electron transport complex protein RnfB